MRFERKRELKTDGSCSPKPTKSGAYTQGIFWRTNEHTQQSIVMGIRTYYIVAVLVRTHARTYSYNYTDTSVRRERGREEYDHAAAEAAAEAESKQQDPILKSAISRVLAYIPIYLFTYIYT